MADPFLASLDHVVDDLAQRISAHVVDLGQTTPLVGRGPRRYLIPTGTHALRVFHPGDDLHLVCMSDDTTATFWNIVRETLEDVADIDPELELERDPEDQSIKLEWKTVVAHNDAHIPTPKRTIIHLHFCPLAAEPQLALIPKAGLPLSKRHLYPIFTQHHYRVSTTLKQLDALQALPDGGTRFKVDYLCIRAWADAMGWMSPLLGIVDADSLLCLVHDGNAMGGDADLLERFCTGGHGTSALSAMLGPYRIQPQAAAAISQSRQHVEELCRANGNNFSTSFLKVTQMDAFGIFLDMNKWFLLVTVECWDRQIWSRVHKKLLPSVVIQVTEKISGRRSHVDGTGARIWPLPAQGDGSLSYVIGVSEDANLTPSTLEKLWTQVIQLNAVEGALIGARPCEKQDLAEFLNSSTTASANTSIAPLAQARAQCAPASAVIKRLRNHPAHFGVAYEVGYHDRFDGLQWMPLEQWGGKAVEEDDFIPEHRIRQFRRKADQAVVWDREAKMDWT